MPNATVLALPVGGSLAAMDPLELAVKGYLARYRGSTLKDYTLDLKVFLAWSERVGLKPLEASRPHLELYVRWLEQQGWASSTVSRRFGTVAGMYKYAARDEIIPKDPAAFVDKPQVRLDEQRRTFLNPLEFAQLLAASRKAGPVEHCLVALLGLAGLRISEACSLNVESIHIEGGYDIVRFIGKGNKPAVVPLPGPVLRPVKAVIADRDSGPLLLNRWGNRMDRHAATRIIRRLAEQAHVNPDISPHSLRRTFCTSGLVSGVPLRDMQLAMRHADPNTTTRYDMAAKSLDRHAGHRVASYLAGMTG